MRQQLAARALHLELVARAGLQVREEQLPDPEAVPQPHRIHAPVPVIEVADQADPARGRRPNGEEKSFDGSDRDPVRAESPVMSFAADVAGAGELLVVEDRTDRIGIVARARTVGSHDPEAVPGSLARSERRDKDAGLMAALHGGESGVAVGCDHFDRERLRKDRTDLPHVTVDAVRPQHRERIGMFRAQDRRDALRRERRRRFWHERRRGRARLDGNLEFRGHDGSPA
jgi:hypothetical protein